MKTLYTSNTKMQYTEACCLTKDYKNNTQKCSLLQVVQVFYLYLWNNTKKWTCCIVLLLYEGMTHKFFGTYLAMQMFVPKTVLQCSPSLLSLSGVYFYWHRLSLQFLMCNVLTILFMSVHARMSKNTCAGPPDLYRNRCICLMIIEVTLQKVYNHMHANQIPYCYNGCHI